MAKAMKTIPQNMGMEELARTPRRSVRSGAIRSEGLAGSRPPKPALAKNNPGSTSQVIPHALAHFEPHSCKTCQSGGNAWIQSWLEWYRE
jgi:hypothetical protein